MLKEFRNVRQIENEGKRRWFTDDYFELIFWYEPDGQVKGFQLCYDKNTSEKAITWKHDEGYTHNYVDAGDTPGGPKLTPVLKEAGEFDREKVARMFLRESEEIDSIIADFVYKKILGFN